MTNQSASTVSDEELALLRGMVASSPERRSQRVRLAQRLRAAGRLGEAIDEYWRIVELDPLYVKAWEALFELYAATKNSKGMVQVLQRRIEALGGDLDAHRRLALLLKTLGQTEEAARHQKILADARSGDLFLPKRPPKSSGSIEQIDDAIEKARSRLDDKRGERAAHRWRLYKHLAKRKSFAEAAAHLQAWIDAPDGGGAATPEDLCDAMDRLARLYATTGDARREVEVLRRQQKVGRKTAQAQGRLFRLNQRLGRTGKAQALLQSLEEMAATDPEAAVKQARLKRAASFRPDRAAHFAEISATGPQTQVQGAGHPEGRLAGHTLVFPHNYKTGGTSVRAGLRRIFAPHLAVLGSNNYRRALQERPPEVRAALDMVLGHFGFDDAEDGIVPLLAKEPLYIGVVRDPVDRAKSIYQFFMQTYGGDLDRLRRLRVQADDDFDVVTSRWLDSPETWNGWKADQCRGICGEATAEAAVRTIRARYLAVVTPGGINRLLQTLGEAMGRPLRKHMHRKATGSTRTPLDLALERQLRVYHNQDQLLFEWVRDNEDRMIARAAASLVRAEDAEEGEEASEAA